VIARCHVSGQGIANVFSLSPNKALQVTTEKVNE
jgi:hypothetical protein